MGQCCSSPSPDPPGDPQQSQPRRQGAEPRRGESLSPSNQGLVATPESVNPVKLGESNPASTPSQPDEKPSRRPPRSDTSNSPSPQLRLRASTSVHPSFDSARMGPPVTGEEAYQKPLHRHSRSKSLSSPHRRGSTSAYQSYGPSPASGTSPSPSSTPRRGHVHGYRHQNRFDSAPDPPIATRGNNARLFPSTVREVLPDGFRFRILVLGKSLSGKSSLVNAVFNVDMAAAPAGYADINVGFNPRNNRYVVVHEYSGFESGDAQSLQTIGDFISYRTDASLQASERLHSIWICVPMSDAIERGLGESVTKILGMKKVTVLIVFTKFDLLVSRVQFDITRGVIQTHEDPGARARTMYEDLCRSLFHKDPKDVPAAIFSKKSAYRDLIGDQTWTTHRFIRFIKADSHNSLGHPTSSQVQQPTAQIIPELLAWSIAQRVGHNITIQASIEVGRSRYWRSLGSSQDFTGQALENCVNVIHEDIINVWNFDDKERYLLTPDFTAKMSHVVGDLAGSPAISPDPYSTVTATPMAQWTNGPYQNNHKNIRCIMAYIVDLTVILYRLFESRHNVSTTNVQSAVRNYAKSITRDRIHGDIRSFVTQIPFTYQNKDTIMEVIVDLIKQNCVRTPDRS